MIVSPSIVVTTTTSLYCETMINASQRCSPEKALVSLVVTTRRPKVILSTATWNILTPACKFGRFNTIISKNNNNGKQENKKIKTGNSKLKNYKII